MMKNKYGRRKTFNMLASIERDKSVFEYEAYFGAYSAETLGEEHHGQLEKSQRTKNKVSGGKLLIDANDPLVVKCIDENEFIRNIGGSCAGDESVLIRPSAFRQNSASESFITDHNYFKK